MKRPLLALAILAAASAARADTEQASQVTFGVAGMYVPQQHALVNDVAAVGHYVDFSHRFDAFLVGARAGIFYGWAATGDTASQWLVEADLFLGAHAAIGKRFALRLEAGTGALIGGGDGYATAGVNHTFVRATAQWNAVKTLLLEAYGGPSFLVGASVLAGFPEFGVGAGFVF